MVSYEELSTLGLLNRIAKGRFVRANQVGVDEFATLTPQQPLEFLGNRLKPQGLTAGFGGMIARVDGTIHHQDIRRALDQPRTIPEDRLKRVLGLVPNNPRLGARRYIKGLRLRATDLDWVHGRGPEVTGPEKRCSWQWPAALRPPQTSPVPAAPLWLRGRPNSGQPRSISKMNSHLPKRMWSPSVSVALPSIGRRRTSTPFVERRSVITNPVPVLMMMA
jgi:hypothetical protein